LKETLSGRDAPVVTLSTVSSLNACFPQIEEILRHKKCIVSTCEELAHPWETHPDLSRKIDRLAKENGVAVLGTGVNPGFAMDFLPVVASGVCSEVKRIKVFRIQDASFRRLPFQKKIGVGLSVAEFEEKKATQEIRHVGLEESIRMIAQAFGWKVDRIEEAISPVIAESPVGSQYMKVKKGDVKGMHQVGRGFVKGKELITLEMVMALGQENPRDAAEIEGVPNLHLVFEGGIHGDIATAAVVVNSIAGILKLSPGLKTMLDMGLVHFAQ
jgi:4-hydroxy-tetrahydrodipicolinate reductase